MSTPPVRFQRTYVTLAAADLRKTYIRDTIVVDDTGAGVADVALQLPKIGTAYAPVGLRTTVVKASNATHAVAITPNALDAVSSGAPGAFPDFGAAGAANRNALLAGQPGSVTLEATDMALVGSTQPNPTGGTPTTAGAWLAIESGSGGASGAVVPTSPVYYVASTGSNAATQPGTLAEPLLTVGEALQRLAASGWTQSADIWLVDHVDEGASPRWTIPAAVGNAFAITIRSMLNVDIAGIAVTGGTAANIGIGAVLGAQIATADGSAVNTQRGKIATFKTGALAGVRVMINSNDGAGGFDTTASLSAVPAVGMTIDISSRAGGITWSGRLTVICPGAAIFDALEMLPTGVSAQFVLEGGGVLVSNACRWTSVAASFGIMIGAGWWFSGAGFNGAIATSPTSTGPIPFPTGITICGERVDGSAAAINLGGVGGTSSTTASSAYFHRIEGLSAQSSEVVFTGAGSMTLCFLNDCGISINGGLSFGSATLLLLRITNGRKVTGSGAFNTGIVAIVNGARAVLNNLFFVTPVTGNNLLDVRYSGVVQSIAAIAGAATGAADLFLNVLAGGSVAIANGTASTATGGTAGTDIVVDGGVGFAVALLQTIGVIASQNGSFQHSTDSTAAPGAATINKLVGKSALAIGTGTGAGIDITNSLVAVGDQVQVTFIDIDATATTIAATAGAGKFTVKTNANATAITKYQWRVTKATV